MREVNASEEVANSKFGPFTFNEFYVVFVRHKKCFSLTRHHKMIKLLENNMYIKYM